METTIEKLFKLHKSVQNLETALQAVWSDIDEIEGDPEYKALIKKAKQYQSKKQKPDEKLDNLCARLDEFDNYMDEIPEDGAAAVDFEDSISELIEWLKENEIKSMK